MTVEDNTEATKKRLGNKFIAGFAFSGESSHGFRLDILVRNAKSAFWLKTTDADTFASGEGMWLSFNDVRDLITTLEYGLKLYEDDKTEKKERN